MREDARPLEERLAEAAAGLTYASETDAPVTPFVLAGFSEPGPSDADLLAFLGLDGTTVGEISLDEFFAPATTEQDWFGPEERASSSRFRALRTLLEGALTGIRVLRVGERDLDVVVIGRTRAGSFAGVHTRVVET